VGDYRHYCNQRCVRRTAASGVGRGGGATYDDENVKNAPSATNLSHKSNPGRTTGS